MQNLSESQTERRNKVTLNHGLSRGGYVDLEERIVIYFLNILTFLISYSNFVALSELTNNIIYCSNEQLVFMLPYHEKTYGLKLEKQRMVNLEVRMLKKRLRK